MQVGFHLRREEAAHYYLSAFTKGGRDRYFYRRHTELINMIRKYIFRLHIYYNSLLWICQGKNEGRLPFSVVAPKITQSTCLPYSTEKYNLLADNKSRYYSR